MESYFADMQQHILDLLDGEYTSFSFTLNNETAANNMTVAEWADWNERNIDDWKDKADFIASVVKNALWNLHWYPNSPVGFYSTCGSSLQNAAHYGFKEGVNFAPLEAIFMQKFFDHGADSLGLDYNGHSECYESAAEHLSKYNDLECWISKEDRDKAISDNTVWEASFTRGSHPKADCWVYRASSLPILIDLMMTRKAQ